MVRGHPCRFCAGMAPSLDVERACAVVERAADLQTVNENVTV